MAKRNRYEEIIEYVFRSAACPGSDDVDFRREDIIQAAQALEVPLPKNIGDLIYSFRYRQNLPPSIVSAAPPGKAWVIQARGRGHYAFVAITPFRIFPQSGLIRTKIPDATPGTVAMYLLDDEQALLARLRYNRLLDIFLRIACYSLQSHLRTTVPQVGQIETDEVCVGVDQRGAHYVIPVQAKRHNDRLSAVQFLQDFAMCAEKFPKAMCLPVGAQFCEDGTIALFAIHKSSNDILSIADERHYRLVPPERIKDDDLQAYRNALHPR